MGQYFESNPNVGSSRKSIDLHLPDLSLELTTDRGVFSGDHVDDGTKMLLVEGPTPNPDDQNMLDIGTGYGPITCALGVRNPQATIWGVETNTRAIELCQHNAALNGLANVRASAPDGVPNEVRFDRIWSNPPIRIGKSALHDLLLQWLPRLTTDGSAHLVVQKHLGADSLHRWLEEQGFAVTRRKSRKAFRLLDVTLGDVHQGEASSY